MNDILSAILVVGIVGLAFGLLLAVAAIIFKVEVDERIEKIEEVLPSANCGACGFAGCSAYAAAVVNDGAAVNLCGVGGGAVSQQIGGIMGTAVAASVPKVARVHCAGTCEKAKDRFEYYGVETCEAAAKFAGGQKACSEGCLGFGSCVSACMFDAIRVVDGVAIVDEDKCTACGACVKACPKNIIELLPKDNKTYVKCSNHKPGKAVTVACSVGCIGCKICEKNCPFEAVSVKDNLAVIDYEKCQACGVCAEKCPKKVIS